MPKWTFDKNGDIGNENGQKVKFTELVKHSLGSVRDIDGNPLPIDVANAQRLGGVTPAEYRKVVDELPLNNLNTGVVGGTVTVTEEEVITYIECGISALGNDTNQPQQTSVNVLGTKSNLDGVGLGSLRTANPSFAGGVMTFPTGSVGGDSVTVSFDMVAGEVYAINFIADSSGAYLILADNYVYTVLYNKDVGVVNTTYVQALSSGNKVLHFRCAANSVLSTISPVSFSHISINETAKISDNMPMITTLINKDRVSVNSIVTGIRSRDLADGGYLPYENTHKNNLKFYIDSFHLMEYINPIPNLPEVKLDASGQHIPLITNSDGLNVGDLLLATDINGFVGSAEVTNSYLSGLVVTLTTPGGVAVTTHPTTITTAGKYKLSVTTTECSDGWEFGLNGVTYPPYVHDLTTLNGSPMTTVVIVDSITGVNELTIKNIGGLFNDRLVVTKILLEEIDTTVWSDVTPTLPNESTREYYWDSSDVKIIPTTNSAGGMCFNSLLGSKICYFEDSVNAPSYLPATLTDFTTTGVNVALPSADYVFTQRGYDRLVMYVDSYGNKILSASDSVVKSELLMCRNGDSQYISVRNPDNVTRGLVRNVFLDTINRSTSMFVTDIMNEINGMFDEVVRYNIGGVLAELRLSGHQSGRVFIRNNFRTSIHTFLPNNEYCETIIFSSDDSGVELRYMDYDIGRVQIYTHTPTKITNSSVISFKWFGDSNTNPTNLELALQQNNPHYIISDDGFSIPPNDPLSPLIVPDVYSGKDSFNVLGITFVNKGKNYLTVVRVVPDSKLSVTNTSLLVSGVNNNKVEYTNTSIPDLTITP